MPANITKKFINAPETVVDDSIRGLVAINDQIKVHEGCNRVVLRADIVPGENSKVSLLAGGGSGHEPFAAGFVGRGLLSGAVCGNVFASPPTSHVYAALEALRNKNGTVVFVINYTGDRLNFGLAIERFNSAYTQMGAAWMALIDDDVALESNKQGKGIGRRGIAGAVLVIKIAGAMAEAGTSADEIAVTAQSVNDQLGTVGVSLQACSIPGKGPMFELGSNEMELGLGIHGEPGCERISYQTAAEIVDVMLKRLESSEKHCLIKGGKVAVLLNNLGGTSQIEMNILIGEIVSWLYSHEYSIIRMYCATMMTSLDGHGISISILNVIDNQWLTYLDAEATAPGWTVSPVIPNGTFVIKEILSKETPKYEVPEVGVTLSNSEADVFKLCIERACSAITAAAEKLDNLDSHSGDGDCGSTLSGGSEQIRLALSYGRICCSRPQTAFNQISHIFEADVGGTTGALYALMFGAASAAFEKSAAASDWYSSLKKGLEAIMRYGQAQPGQRSMVDPLHAAVNSIKGEIIGKNEWGTLVKVAEEAAAATKGMRAQCGRASYTAESTQTEPDPGATAVAIWMRAAYEAAFP